MRRDQRQQSEVSDQWATDPVVGQCVSPVDTRGVSSDRSRESISNFQLVHR